MMSPRSMITLVVTIGGLSTLLQGCGGGGGGGGAPKTIPEIAGKTADLSTLVTALQTAGLVDTLAGSGPYTVFAPTNKAFSDLPKAELTYLLNNKAALTKVLEYHVASGSVLSTDLSNGEKIKTLEGENVTVAITKASNGTTVKINDAMVTTANVKASNGVVHIIDKVLVPPSFTAPTIPELAAAANLSTLVAAVTAAKLGATLSGAGPFTVFAPTNAAFTALPAGVLTALLKPENIKSLTSVLTYHVVAGEVLSSDLKNGEQVKTVETQNVSVTIAGSKVSINNATVTKPNVFAVNGVVHVIDAVLLPPGFVPPSALKTIPEIAETNADLSTLVSALRDAGLVDTLAGTGPFTVFAPSNAAFGELPKAELTYLLNNKTALAAVLKYHVASGSVLSTDLSNGEKIETLEGENVTVAITKTSNSTTVKVNDAMVTTANVKASNGVVHIIDKVLMPPSFTAPTIPELATAANLTTLVAAVTAAKLGATLSGAGPFTVFAPTNAAFTALPAGVLTALLKPENIKSLATVLTYHVVSGEVLSSDLKNGEQVKTLEGQSVNITVAGSDVSINSANVTEPNVFAVNGVVHVIDAVLLPPGFVPPSDQTQMVIV